MKMNLARCSAPTRTCRLCVVASATSPSTSRRQALVASVGLLALFPNPSQAANFNKLCTNQDGAEGTECRKALITADVPGSSQEDYAAATTRTFEVASGGPVSTLDAKYARDTRDLIKHMRDYTTIDMYSKGRAPLIKEIKSDGSAWVSKFARGGSARALSARKMYIAVDSLFGHLSANGLAPLSASKAKSILATLDEVETFLAKSL